MGNLLRSIGSRILGAMAGGAAGVLADTASSQEGIVGAAALIAYSIVHRGIDRYLNPKDEAKPEE